jgi:hypothetical protein
MTIRININPAPTFTVPVLISVPGAEPAKISVTFRHKGRKALDAWIKRPAEAKTAGTEIADADYLGEIIADWADIGADDRPVPYSRDALADLLDAYPTSGTELFNAYLKALTEAREKN